MNYLTVGIPIYKEKEHVGSTLQTIFSSRLPSSVLARVIVCVNNPSSSESKSIIEEVQKTAKRLNRVANVRVIALPIANKPSAINAIFSHEWAKESNNQAVALVDADILVPKETLGVLFGKLVGSRSLLGVGARLKPSEVKTFSQALAHIPNKVAKMPFLSGGCMMIKPSAIPLIGKIPSNIITDDLYMSAKLGLKRISLLPNAFVWYHVPKTMKEWFLQASRQWAGVVQVKKMFGSKVTDELLNPSLVDAVKQGLRKWKKFSVKERLAIVAALPAYSVIKGAARFHAKNGTWKPQDSTKKIPRRMKRGK